jgi:ABC-type multidrug transport system fused ATPase/permease subunit
MSNISEKLSRKDSGARRPDRQVRLNLVHLNFWSAFKLSAVAGVIFGIFSIIIVLIIWNVLNSAGTFDDLGGTVSTLTDKSGGAAVSSLFSLSRVMTVTIALAVVDVFVIILAGMIACGLYNLSTKMTGGLNVGFSQQ